MDVSILNAALGGWVKWVEISDPVTGAVAWAGSSEGLKIMPLIHEKSQQIFREKQPGIRVGCPEMVKEIGRRSSACTCQMALAESGS
jgi:hypothetical protein